MIVIVSLLLAVTLVAVIILINILKKNKKSASLLKKQYQESVAQTHSLKEEKEMLQEELEIIKDIYRNKLLRIYNQKNEVA